MAKEEMLDVLNRIGYKTGKTVSRAEAHEKGLYHKVACGTLIDPQGYIILNKRGKENDIFPGRWIPIIGGHVLAGEDSLEAIMRESYEELGVSLKKEDIYQTGVSEMIDSSSISKGNNKEIIDFMIMNCETPLEEMKLDNKEISAVKRQEYHTVVDNIIRGRSPLIHLPKEFVYKSIRAIRKYTEALEGKSGNEAA